jgi:hypothetical protein
MRSFGQHTVGESGVIAPLSSVNWWAHLLGGLQQKPLPGSGLQHCAFFLQQTFFWGLQQNVPLGQQCVPHI